MYLLGISIVISFDELSMRPSTLYTKRTQGNLKKKDYTRSPMVVVAIHSEETKTHKYVWSHEKPIVINNG